MKNVQWLNSVLIVPFIFICESVEECSTYPLNNDVSLIVGYTKDNIELDWKHPNPFSTERLEMPQFYLSHDNIELKDYELPYSESKSYQCLVSKSTFKEKGTVLSLYLYFNSLE